MSVYCNDRRSAAMIRYGKICRVKCDAVTCIERGSSGCCSIGKCNVDLATQYLNICAATRNNHYNPSSQSNGHRTTAHDYCCRVWAACWIGFDSNSQRTHFISYGEDLISSACDGSRCDGRGSVIRKVVTEHT